MPKSEYNLSNDEWVSFDGSPSMPLSKWYELHPETKPKEFYDENDQPHPFGVPIGTGPVGAPEPTTPIAPPTGAPPVPGVASPVDPMAARAETRNPIYSNMATQLSPTTMTALSGYQAQMPQRKKQFGGFGGLPFGRNLFGRGY